MDACPVCSTSIPNDLSQAVVQRHINACLDGNGASVPLISPPILVVGAETSHPAAVSSIELLQELCPGIPVPLAQSLLDACDGNVDAAVVLIQELQSQQQFEQRRLPQQESNSLQRSKPPQWIPPVDVELIVYDLKPDGISKHIGFGVYHSAVIINGKEYAFGGSPDSSDAERPGIFTCHPASAAPDVKKRYTVGQTMRTPEEVAETLKEWGRTTWKVGSYHLLSRNCNHFADAFLRYLGESIPQHHLKNLNDEIAQLIDQESCEGGASSRFGVSETTKKRRKLEGELKKLREQNEERWCVPDWVNRAARFGSTLVPDFVYQKVVGSQAKETPNQSNSGSSPQVATTSPADPPVEVTGVVLERETESAMERKSKVDPTSVQAIKAILPSKSETEIRIALRRSKGNVDSAVELLL